MRRVLVTLVAVLLVGACGSGGDGPTDTGGAGATVPTDPPTTVTNPPDTVELATVQISVVDFEGDGFVRLVNVGDSDADLTGHWMVQQGKAVDLGAEIDPVIPVGDSLDISGVGVGGVSAEGGEIALFAGGDWDNAESLVAFVQWGSGGTHEAVAVDAGLWPEGVTVEPDPNYSSIELFGDPANPESWS